MDTAVKRENMEQELLLQMLNRGIDDIKEGRVLSMDEAFEKGSEYRNLIAYAKEKAYRSQN